jgi:hypothetical protein
VPALFRAERPVVAYITDPINHRLDLATIVFAAAVWLGPAPWAILNDDRFPSG